MRFLRQSLVGVFLTAVTLGLLVYAGQLIGAAVQDRMSDERTAPPARERVFAVNVIRAVAGRETPLLEAFGQVQSRRTLELRTATSGRVVWLATEFTEGGVVEAGQLLLRIDPADAQSLRDRARSDLLDAQAEVRDADRSLALAGDELAAAQEQAILRDRAFRRQQDLEARGVGTAAAVETAELAAAQARQQVLSRRIAQAQAEARVDQAATSLARASLALDQAERDLAETEVFAAFDGTLSDVTLVEGRLLSANEKLAELIDPAELEVAFRVSTSQYARLLDTRGVLIPADVTATLDGAGAELTATGRISRDSAGPGEVQTGRLLYATLETARGFKPGDFVTVAVQEPAVDNVVRLPASAYGSGGTVLVLDSDDRLEALPVTLVRRQGDDVLLRGVGLTGREVVQARTPLLGAGIRVRPLRDAAPGVEEQAMLQLEPERRARLVAFVEGSTRMPEAAKTRILNQLAQERVPEQMVRRIEARMGG
ncbi:HlyD family efflux transporter periplasmic adaptor subunit [Aestuariivita sp.]|jgi:multidrug efflux pump subunit AcrA (membrane-fusion protein)|uniref:efflux RND transporter periplasmic adaptor subunit n=1 Tax=Aestuariivita sp. TaxID=1872407 RepID=UPI0021721FC9|nr:HlyD family efflux transporter periplasmic adaptor subunit [Aestuariivita sp.]MCE8009203.1 HlyD family efflux transporter periplasmic adaptor subunit [Aestuariivita sp.]